MSVLMVMEAPGATREEYDRANEILGISGDDDAPDGLIQHVAAFDDEGLVIVDLWESEEAIDRFFDERLGAALDEAGVLEKSSGPARRHEVHNALTGQGSDANALMLIELSDFGTDAYDQMVSNMDAHVGDGSQHPCVTHVAARSADGGVLVADLWESPEAFGKFGEEQIGPAGAAAGLGPIEPRIIPVHNRVRGRAAVGAG
jgi:hypothetical protein